MPRDISAQYSVVMDLTDCLSVCLRVMGAMQHLAAQTVMFMCVCTGKNEVKACLQKTQTFFS